MKISRHLSKITSDLLNFKNQNKVNNHSFLNSYQSTVLPMYPCAPYGIMPKGYVKIGTDVSPDGKEVHVYKLSNGQTVKILQQPGNSVITTKVGVGSFDETGYPQGISHFLEHSIFHSSAKYHTDLFDKFNEISTDVNASTSNFETRYYAVLSSDSIDVLKDAIDIQADMLINPRFDKLEKEKKIVTAELSHVKLADAGTHANAISLALSMPDSSYMETAGTVESVNMITRDVLLDYHQKFYQPSNFETIVVSKHNPDEVIKTISNAFLSRSSEPKSLPTRLNLPVSTKQTRLDTYSDNISNDEYTFVFANKVCLNSFEKAKIDALFELLSSKYGLDSPSFRTYADTQIIKLGVSTDKFPVDQYFNFLSYALEDIKANPLSEFELSELKNKLLKPQTSLSDSNLQTAMQIFDYDATIPNSKYSEYINAINSLSSFDIMDALKYIDLSRASIAVAHPSNTKQEDVQRKHSASLNQVSPLIFNTVHQNKIYPFKSNVNQITGQKFYTTCLDNNTQIVAFDDESEENSIQWIFNCEGNYEFNPAAWYMLNESFVLGFSGIFFDKITNTIQKKAYGISDNLDEGLFDLKSFYHAFSHMSEEVFEKEKTSILEQLESMEYETDDKFNEFLIGQDGFGDKDTIKEGIKNLTLSECLNSFKQAILNSKSMLYITGPIVNDINALNKVANYMDTPGFKFVPQGALTRIQKPLKSSKIVIDNAYENRFDKIYDFPISGNVKDDYCFHVLASVLSQKNKNLIREQYGLSYSSGATYIPTQTNNSGHISLEAETACNSQQEIEQVFNAYDKNVSEVLRGNISETELLIAKNKVKGMIAQNFQSLNASMATFIEDVVVTGKTESYNYANSMVDSIKIEDIIKAANHVFASKPRYFANVKQNVYDNYQEFFNTLK